MAPILRHRIAVAIFMPLYCAGILLALDLFYSTFLYQEGPPDYFARISDTRYHHGFVANYQGHEDWGGIYPIFTNSLGFKDGLIREVPAKPNIRRVLLIGDSFTEGIGVSFPASFAGLLYQAGQAREEPIEFLNAAVSGYSPVIYFQKTKFLLEKAFRFDEVVLLLDVSDLVEEATQYFCIDDDPEYNRFCQPRMITNVKSGTAYDGILSFLIGYD
jgi:hypothetical protein